MNDFLSAFGGAFGAVFQVFLVVFAGGLLIRKNVIAQEQIHSLSTLVVRVFLPCLIFSKITDTFQPDEFPGWWKVPLLAAGTLGTGFLLCSLFFKTTIRQHRHLFPLGSIQNAVYLVIPVGLALYPGKEDEVLLIIFLYSLGVNPVLWSVGKFLTTSGSSNPTTGFKSLLSPPLITNLLAHAFVFTEARTLLPDPLTDSVRLLGNAAVPGALFVLGATLGSIPFRLQLKDAKTLKLLSIKLFIVPAIVLLLARGLNLHSSYELLGLFLVIEAASPPAAGIMLQIRSYGGYAEEAGSIMLLAYLLCVVTLPFWMSVWQVSEKLF